MKFTANARELSRLINSAMRVVSKDDTRKIIMNIEMLVKDTKLSVTALDGYRMVQKHLGVRVDREGGCVILPGRLLRLIDKTPGDVIIEQIGDALHIETAYVKASIPVTDGEYIKHATIWPDPDRERIRIAVNPRLLSETVKTLIGLSECIVMDIPKDITKPIGLSAADGSGDRAIVLPVRMFDLEA